MPAAKQRHNPATRLSWLFVAVCLSPWNAVIGPAQAYPDDDIPTIPSAAQRALQPPAPVASPGTVKKVQPETVQAKQPVARQPDNEETTETAASERWAQCPPAAPQSRAAPATDPDKIDLHADSAESSADNVYSLKGNAVVQHGAQRVRADQITYRQAEGEILASGDVRFTAPGLEVNASTANIQSEQNTGRLEELRYSLPELHARGTARAMRLEGRTRQHLEEASYTTCAGENPDWILTADEVELDHAAGRGTARGAKLAFKNVPVAWLPRISFPTDERRKSGLLSPSYGQNDETGTDISLPYYHDIAANYDATIVPRLMSDRGLLLGGEFRYLHENNRGEIRAEFLESDKRFDDRERSLFSIRHSGRPVPRMGTYISASNVSDKAYFEDLGTTIVQTSQSSLERTANADWHGDWWGADIMVQDYQNIDPAVASSDRAYKQLPRIHVHAAPEKRLLGLAFSARAEFNRFDHSDADKVTGSRFDIQPRVSLPLRRTAWYVEPALSLRHTRYDLDGTANGTNSSPARTTPVISIDAGSFFERSMQWGDNTLLQTLEPRAYYLYVADKNQEDIPLFDTGTYDFNFWSLFRENRFTGPDRMGDANQAALAVTTRLLEPGSGRQILSASLGSLLYFNDREVTLPGATTASDDTSDLVGELSMNLGKSWNANAELQWNPHESQTSRNNYRLQYRAGQRNIVNASYRRRRDRQEQADLSFLWPLSASWHMVGRWYYSLDDNRTIEAIAGLGYDSCCWGARLIGRNYINDNENDRNSAVFLQLELKGLGATGSRVDDVLERGILGYQSRN